VREAGNARLAGSNGTHLVRQKRDARVTWKTGVVRFELVRQVVQIINSTMTRWNVDVPKRHEVKRTKRGSHGGHEVGHRSS
jgi:hypothetical protein